MDSRDLFINFTGKKVPWSSSPDRCRVFTDKMLEALKAMPRLYVGENVSAFDKVFTNEYGPEHVVVREMNNAPPELYYVNTEGYDYARFHMRLPDIFRSYLKIE